MPGIVLFHDLLLWDSGPVPLYCSPWEQVVEKFKSPSCPWPSRAEHFEQRGPLAYREAAFAGVALFSTEHGHHEFKRLVSARAYPGPSYYLPYAIDPDQPRIPHGALPVVAYCGSPRIEQRAHKVLLALSQVTQPFRLCWMLENSEQEQAYNLLREFRIANVEFLPGRSPKRWAELTRKADMALHPFFSAYGQPGVYLAISLMANLPSVVSTFGTTEYLSDSLVCKVRPGETEASEIKAWVEVILNGKKGRGSEFPRDERRRRFALENYDRRIVAQELTQVFTAQAAFLRHYMCSWKQFCNDARGAALAEVRGLLERNAAALPGGAEICWDALLQPAFKELGWSR